MSAIYSPNKDLELFFQYGQGPIIPPAFSLIHKAFEHRADTQPHSVAARYSGISITYAELELKSNALANYLIRNGLQPRQRVCLVVQRSIHMLVGILAVLKCGCQYIPLDGGVTPEHYISHLVSDTEASTIICLKIFVSKVQRCVSQDISLVLLDKDDNWLADESKSRPIVDILPEDGAYIIYTSGTSGPPKGVDVSHGNVTNLLCLEPGNLGIKSGTSVAQLLSISFDMGQWEILGTLLNGGTLIIRGSNWSETLKRVDTIISTPSILGTLTKSDYPNIRVVALAGEPCPISLADEWGQDCKLYNCCGPTEVTIVNTTHLHIPGQRISIGRPVPNTSVYILDKDENPAPIGEPGLMWAGGKCVSRGYLNLPQETGKKYKLDRFRGDGSLMYNTGDLCRWLDDGTIEPLGRVDDQVKIKGFRIELASVTIAIETIPGVDKACAIYRDQVLWAFYSGISAIPESRLKAEVAKAQPYYAVPSRWEFRPVLPLTTNGKIDKTTLWNSVTWEKEKTISTPQNAVIKDERKDCQYSATEISTPSGSSIDIESKHEWDLPEKNGRHGWRALRHKFFSVYRRFFSIVLIGNVIGMIAAFRFTAEGENLQILGLACAINLTLSILTRQDYVLNALFTICCSVPVYMPIWIRARCAKIYHIGGIHSGCGVAATVWLALFSGAATVAKTSVAVQAVSYIILTLLLAIVVSAQPKFRSRLHNKFELVHRFAGWTALALFWIQTILLADDTRGDKPLGTELYKGPVLWLLVVVTISIIVPWLHLRKVNVRSDVLSGHAVRLYFDYAHPVSGAAVRLSSHPLTEWHAFATITDPKEKGFSVLVSNAGDWTKHQIDTAPTKIWVRGIPTCGVIRISTLFKRVVLVATGSGIGPCLPVIYAKTIPARVFWSTPKPELTFGSDIIKAIKEADKDAVIHDTKSMGRPDMVAITYRLFRESSAEAVVVISNQKLTQLVVYAMEARGIPAYGAIFDS